MTTVWYTQLAINSSMFDVSMICFQVGETSSDTESAGCERFNVPISQKYVQKSLADILTQPDWYAMQSVDIRQY